jgi:hypothetical protein
MVPVARWEAGYRTTELEQRQSLIVQHILVLHTGVTNQALNLQALQNVLASRCGRQHTTQSCPASALTHDHPEWPLNRWKEDYAYPRGPEKRTRRVNIMSCVPPQNAVRDSDGRLSMRKSCDQSTPFFTPLIPIQT